MPFPPQKKNPLDEEDPQLAELVKAKMQANVTGSGLNARSTLGSQVNTQPRQAPTAPPAAPSVSYGDPNTDESLADAKHQAAKDAAIAAAKKKSQAAQEGIAGLSPEDQAYYQAQKQQLAATSAQDQQNVAARAGLGGMGLSGASAALGADTARVDARNSTLALGDLRGKLGDQEWQKTQRAAALDALEAETDTDYDHDGTIAGMPVGGLIGDHNPDNDPDPNAKPAPGTTDKDGNGVPDFKEGNAREGVGGNNRPFTGNPREYADRGGQTAASWDTYMGSDGTYDYYVQGADGLDGTKKGHKFKVKR